MLMKECVSLGVWYRCVTGLLGLGGGMLSTECHSTFNKCVIMI